MRVRVRVRARIRIRVRIRVRVRVRVTSASCSKRARPRRGIAGASSARARRAPPRPPVVAVQLGALRSHTAQSCASCWHACCTEATASSAVPSMETAMAHACRTTTATSASRVRLPRLAATWCVVTSQSVGRKKNSMMEKPT